MGIQNAALYQGSFLDEVFKKDSVTNRLVKSNLKFDGVKTVYIPDIAMGGLGDYSRTTGYPTGAVNLTWTAYSMGQDRGISYTVDKLDNMEAQDIAFADLVNQTEKQVIAPEIDAYRLSTLCGKAATANKVTGATLAKNTVITAIEKAIQTFEENEVPTENCVLYVSPEVASIIRLNTEVNRFFTETKDADTTVLAYNGIPVVTVPLARFYSAYTFSATNGFAKTSDAVAINFLLVNLDSCVAVMKHNDAKVIAPEINQDADAYKYMIHVYHDIFVPTNKVNGIYVNTK